jgi:hypothetical protein
MDGSPPINTYFVLNKKDRLGIVQSRPFHLVLQEIKRQEIEDAKLKQSANLKDRNVPNHSPKENGFNHSTSPINSKSIESVEIPMKINNDEDLTLDSIQNSLTTSKRNTDRSIKTSEMMSDTRHSTKSLKRRPRSRTCELF